MKSLADEDDGTVVFTFKKKPHKDMDFVAKLRSDMRAAGLNPDEQLSSGRPKWQMVTWGRECATNEFAYCRNVIFVGLMHRSNVDLSGAICGQQGDLLAMIDHVDVLRVRCSELAHLTYQASNRAACRVTTNGQAEKTDIWMFHYDHGLTDELVRAMPGLRVEDWEPKFVRQSSPDTRKVGRQICKFLTNQPPETTKLSISSVKDALDLKQLANGTFQLARDWALADCDWEVDRRSFVRVQEVGKAARSEITPLAYWVFFFIGRWR